MTTHRWTPTEYDDSPVPPRWLVAMSRVLRFNYGVVNFAGETWWVVCWPGTRLFRVMRWP